METGSFLRCHISGEGEMFPGSASKQETSMKNRIFGKTNLATSKTTDPGGCANCGTSSSACNAGTTQRHSHDAHGHGDQFTAMIGKTRRRL